MKIADLKHVHIVGIGGIGVSAIARMLRGRGVSVSGSDRSRTRVTDELEERGVTIFTGEHKEENVPPETDLVLYSIAVPDDNPERVRAREQGVREMSYPEILGEISRGMKAAAVSGTHGKTTTTALTARGAQAADLDPTVVVGSLLSKEEGNFIQGKTDLFVVEACEYKRSFLHLHPHVLIITNIEADHLDYYKDLDDIQGAFRELILKVPKEGAIVCDPRSDAVRTVLKDVECAIVDYTTEDVPPLVIPGAHNRANAQAAKAALRFLGGDEKKIDKGLASFRGIWRRFESHGTTSAGAMVFDDYAHHPTEITATLEAAREKFSERRITVFFEPHLYSRTRDLLDEFARALQGADQVFVAPIYKARNESTEGVSHHDLARKIGERAEAIDSYDEVAAYLNESSKEDEIIFTMGAGPIYTALENVDMEK